MQVIGNNFTSSSFVPAMLGGKKTAFKMCEQSDFGSGLTEGTRISQKGLFSGSAAGISCSVCAHGLAVPGSVCSA